MISLAPFRFRNVLESDGGPISRVSLHAFPVYGRNMYQANVWLADRPWAGARKSELYSDADGTGSAESPMLARHRAISEALERWAYHSKVHAADGELYGFDVDASSNGMAAFPGLLVGQARKHALMEAVERASLLAWWEGLIDGERRATEWPEVSALVLPSPLGVGVTVIAWREVCPGCFAYGHAASADFFGACERAVVELARNEYVLTLHRLAHQLGDSVAPKELFERRCLFFSSPAGHALFQERLNRPKPPISHRYRAQILHDCEIPGPWSRYAAVWRVVTRPPSNAFLANTERYFFW